MARNKEEPAEGAPVELVDIVITAPHVYLPLDDDGNVPENWRDPTEQIEHMRDQDGRPLRADIKMQLAAKLDSKRIPKRKRLKAPSDCAVFLSDRDQAEIV